MNAPSSQSSPRRFERALHFVRRHSPWFVVAALIGAFFLGTRFGGAPHVHPGHEQEDGASKAGRGAVAIEGSTAVQTLYTCSMHPNVRLPDPEAKCPICFMDLIPVREQDARDPGGARRLALSPEAVQLARIRTARVYRDYPEGEIRLVGRVAIDETRLASVSANFPGRLDRLFVDYTGIRVRRGDHLAEIYSPELVAAQEELLQALASTRASAGRSPTLRGLAEATLAAARDKLRLWGLDTAQIAALEERGTPRERVTIYSPIAGVVIERRATEGDFVKTGDEVLVLADLDHLWVLLEAFESQLAWLHYGQRVTFTTDAWPGRSFEGRISFIDPVVDAETRTIAVRVNVEDHEGRLKPGMFVRTRVAARFAEQGKIVDPSLSGKWISPMHPEVIKDGPGACDVCGMALVPAEELGYVKANGARRAPLVVPATAPLVTGTRSVVYVQVSGRDERPSYESREVALGPRVGDVYLIESGLEEGEEVVVEGAFALDSAMQIAAKPSMMDPDGAQGSLGAASSHGAHGPSESASSSAPPRESSRVPTPVLEGLANVYESYFEAQEALASDALDRARRAFEALGQAVATAPVGALSGESLGRWRRAADRIEGAVKSADVTDIASLRAAFEPVSLAILDIEERFGHVGATSHFRVHCPMAFDDRGAPWLARRNEVFNPYFGAAMLRCGQVEREYPARATEAMR